MNDELERKLMSTHPRIFGLDQPAPTPSTYWGIECGDGWFAILETLCDDIQTHVDEKLIPQVQLRQIKEKFGELRIYYLGGDSQVEELVHSAEIASQTACENCGRSGTRQRTHQGWIKTLCATCLAEANQI